LECTEKPECHQVAIDETRPGEMRFFLEFGQELLAEEIFYELGIEIRHVIKPPWRSNLQENAKVLFFF